MFEKIKQDLFTPHGIATTLIHLFVLVGFATCWIAFNTQVLGKDPLATFQKPAATPAPSINKK